MVIMVSLHEFIKQGKTHRLHLATFGRGNKLLVKFLNFLPEAPLMEGEAGGRGGRRVINPK